MELAFYCLYYTLIVRKSKGFLQNFVLSERIFFFTWGAYLQKQDYKHLIVEADCTTCYTVADFSREYQRGVFRRFTTYIDVIGKF